MSSSCGGRNKFWDVRTSGAFRWSFSCPFPSTDKSSDSALTSRMSYDIGNAELRWPPVEVAEGSPSQALCQVVTSVLHLFTTTPQIGDIAVLILQMDKSRLGGGGQSLDLPNETHCK